MSHGSKPLKTEHAGAKNGGGYWGGRAEAKEYSNVQRRAEDRRIARESLDDDATLLPNAVPLPPEPPK